MGVEPFPGPKRRIRTLSTDEIYATLEPSDAMVWEVCPYLRMNLDDARCLGCPHDEPVEPCFADYAEEGDRMQKGCRGIAEEICRIILAIQNREG